MNTKKQSAADRLRKMAKDEIASYNQQIKESEPCFPQWAYDILETLDEAAIATVSDAQPVGYLLEPIGRLSKLVAPQFHFDRPVSGRDWNVIPLGPIACHPQAAQPQTDDEGTDYECPDCGKLNYRPLDCGECGRDYVAAQPQEAGQAREFLVWWTSIETDARKSLLKDALNNTERLHSLLRMVYEAAQAATAVPQHILDDLDFDPTENRKVADMANVGNDLMDRIESLPYRYMWNNSPAEIVGDLMNEIEELKAAPSVSAAQPTGAGK